MIYTRLTYDGRDDWRLITPVLLMLMLNNLSSSRYTSGVSAAPPADSGISRVPPSRNGTVIIETLVRPFTKGRPGGQRNPRSERVERKVRLVLQFSEQIVDSLRWHRTHELLNSRRDAAPMNSVER